MTPAATLVIGPTDSLGPTFDAPIAIREAMRLDAFGDRVAEAVPGGIDIVEWASAARPPAGLLIVDCPATLELLAMEAAEDDPELGRRAIVLGVERGDLLEFLATSQAPAVISTDRYNAWLVGYRQPLRSSVFLRSDVPDAAPGLASDPEGFVTERHRAIDPSGRANLPALVCPEGEKCGAGARKCANVAQGAAIHYR